MNQARTGVFSFRGGARMGPLPQSLQVTGICVCWHPPRYFHMVSGHWSSASYRWPPYPNSGCSSSIVVLLLPPSLGQPGTAPWTILEFMGALQGSLRSFCLAIPNPQEPLSLIRTHSTEEGMGGSVTIVYSN